MSKNNAMRVSNEDVSVVSPKDTASKSAKMSFDEFGLDIDFKNIKNMTVQPTIWNTVTHKSQLGGTETISYDAANDAIKFNYDYADHHSEFTSSIDDAYEYISKRLYESKDGVDRELYAGADNDDYINLPVDISIENFDGTRVSIDTKKLYEQQHQQAVANENEQKDEVKIMSDNMTVNVPDEDVSVIPENTDGSKKQGILNIKPETEPKDKSFSTNGGVGVEARDVNADVNATIGVDKVDKSVTVGDNSTLTINNDNSKTVNKNRFDRGMAMGDNVAQPSQQASADLSK